MLSTSQVLNSRGQAYSSPWAAIGVRAVDQQEALHNFYAFV